MKRYDLDNDGFLRFSDFCDAIQPTTQEYQDILLQKSEGHLEHLSPEEIVGNYQPETTTLIKQVFTSVFDREQRGEQLMQHNIKNGFDLKEAFAQIKKAETGNVDW